MAQRVTDVGIKMIKQWEGLKLYAYRNFQNEPWTIGHGHTSAAGIPNVREGMRINEVEAEEILKADLRKFEEDVSSLVKVPLTPHQFDALVSFAFNVGTGALHKSTLLKKLNAGDYDSVPGELMKWVNAGGKKVKGLVNRRSAEAGLWAKGEYVSSANAPVQKTVAKKDVAVIVGTGAGGAVTSIAPSVPDIIDAVTKQQSELSSGDWARMTVACLIVALTVYGIYRKVRS